MSRNYGKLKKHEKEILKLREGGNSHQAIADKLGFSKYQIKKFFERYNKKQRNLAVAKLPKKKGRPAKDSIVTEEDKIADLRYKLARKDARIKQLEMENELMRDFLSLTERK